MFQAEAYINPLPHALMLTAIVVSLGTTGVGLALLMRIKDLYQPLPVMQRKHPEQERG